MIRATADGNLAVWPAVPGAAVFINGVRLGTDPSPILHGDKLQVGLDELLCVDPHRSGSTQFVNAADVARMAMSMKPGASGKPATASTGGRLVCLTDGREYTIGGGPLVFGREAGSDIVVPNKDVSRRHAEIMATPQGYVVVDSSTNGTFVNGERVQGQRVLTRADVIRVGDHDFRFYADVVAAAPTAVPAPPPPPPAPVSRSIPTPPPPPPPRPLGGPATPASGASVRLTDTMYGAPMSAPPMPAPPMPAPPMSAPPAPAPPAAVSPPPMPAAPRPSQAMATPALTDSGKSAAQGHAPPLATILVRSGQLKGNRLPVRVPVINIGRADYNDLVLPDDSVSSAHAKMQRREGVWILTDLSSTNGSFVDGERVQGEAMLSPGATLKLGDVSLLFDPPAEGDVGPGPGGTKVMGAINIPPAPPPPPPVSPPPAPPRPSISVPLSGPPSPRPSPAPPAFNQRPVPPRPSINRPVMSAPKQSGGSWMVPVGIALLVVAAAAVLFYFLK
jgi:pSer/pThr/pTyr-binding forkhead associated (FHA) protein